VSRRFRLPKDRLAALAADWGLLILLSYCVYFLINYWYRAIMTVRPSYQVPFPGYAYGLTVAATFFLAVLWENMGTSIGWKGVGLVHSDGSHGPLGFGRRAAHLATDLASWTLTLLGAALAVAPLAGLGSLVYGLVARTGIMLVPTVTFWPVGPWHVTLGLTVGLVLASLVVGAGCWWTARELWRWLWPGRKGQTPWVDRAVGSVVCRPSDLERLGRPPRWWQTSWGLMALLFVAVTVYVGALTTQISLSTLVRRAPSTGYFWRRLVSPDFQYFTAPDPDLGDTMLNAIIQTIFMSLMATLLGVLFAFPLSFLGARNMVTRSRLGWGVYTLMRAFFNVGRSIEPFVMAVFFGVCVGYGPFAGVLALFVHTIAALGKLYSEQIESIDPGPVEAITATGGSRAQVLRFGVMPQVIPPFLAFTLYRWDINVRMATIIGIVGGGGIGRFFNYYKNELLYEKVGAVLIIITVVVWVMDYISGRVRERIT
jgi:phosphonate ABC transporter permease subunit PhnE